MKLHIGVIAACGIALLGPVAGLTADKAPATATAKQSSDAKKTPVLCPAVTGTRIRVTSPSGCDKVSNRPMRSYSAEELQNTGNVDLIEALRWIDPAFH